MEEEQYSFDLNLDFLDSSTTTPKNATVIGGYPDHQMQPPFDIETLATRIASVNDIAVQLKTVKDENYKLQKQMHELSESAMSIRSMYEIEKAEKDELVHLSKELKQKCEKAESQLTNKTLHFEQIESKLEEEIADRKPITYKDLALKYQRLALQLDEEKQLHSKEKITLLLLKEYLDSKNLSPLPALKKKSKKVREPSMQCEIKAQCKDQQTQCTIADGLMVSCDHEPKDTCTQGTQYTWYTTTRGTNTPAPNSPKKEFKTQGTQYISSMTTRGTNTFIKMQNIGTNFPEPKSVEEILREMAWDVAPLSPMIESPAEMKEEKVETKSVGTNTGLKNVRKPIDYVVENIKRSDSRPPSRNMYDRVKNETPQMAMPSMNPFATLGMTAPPVHNTVADLWNVLGHTIFAMMQNGQTPPNPLQTTVSNDRLRNVRRSEQGRTCESQTVNGYFDQEYPRDYQTSTRNMATSPIQPPELVSRHNLQSSEFVTQHRPVEIQKIMLNKTSTESFSQPKKSSQADDILQLFPEYSDSLTKRRAIKKLLKASYNIKKRKKKAAANCKVSIPQPEPTPINTSLLENNWKTDMFGSESSLSDSCLDSTNMEYLTLKRETDPKWPVQNPVLETQLADLPTIYENHESPVEITKQKEMFGELPEEEIFCKPYRLPKLQHHGVASTSSFLTPNDLNVQLREPEREEEPSFLVKENGQPDYNVSLPKLSTPKRKRRAKKSEADKANKVYKIDKNSVLLPEQAAVLKPKRSLSLNRIPGGSSSDKNMSSKVQTIADIKKKPKPIMEPPPVFVCPEWMNRRKTLLSQDLSIQDLNNGEPSHGLVMSVERPPDSMFQDIKTCIGKQKQERFSKDKKEKCLSKFIGPMLVNQPPKQIQNENTESTVSKEIGTISLQQIYQPVAKQEPLSFYSVPSKNQSVTILNEQWISNSHDLIVAKQENSADTISHNVQQPELPSVEQEDIPIYFLNDALPDLSEEKVLTCEYTKVTSSNIQENNGSVVQSTIFPNRGQDEEVFPLLAKQISETGILNRSVSTNCEVLVLSSEIGVKPSFQYNKNHDSPLLVLQHQNTFRSDFSEQTSDTEAANCEYQPQKLSCEEIDVKLSQSGFHKLQNIELPKTLPNFETLKLNCDSKNVGCEKKVAACHVPRPLSPLPQYSILSGSPLPNENDGKNMSCKENDWNSSETFETKKPSICSQQLTHEEMDSKNFESNLHSTIELKKYSYTHFNGSSLNDDVKHPIPSQFTKKNEPSSSSGSDSEGELLIDDCPQSSKPNESSFVDLSFVLKTPEKGRKTPEFKTPENFKNTNVMNHTLTNSTEKLVEDYLLNESPGTEGPKFQMFLDRILNEVATPLSPISVIASEKLMHSDAENSCDETAQTNTPVATRKCKRKSAPTAAIAIKRSARLKAKSTEILCAISQKFELGKYTKRRTEQSNATPSAHRLGSIEHTTEEDEPECQPISRKPIVLHQTTEQMFDNFLKQNMKAPELRPEISYYLPEREPKIELDYAPMTHGSTMKVDIESPSWQYPEDKSLNFIQEAEFNEMPSSCGKTLLMYDESPSSPPVHEKLPSEDICTLQSQVKFNTSSFRTEAVSSLSLEESPSSPPAIDKRPTKGHFIRKLVDTTDTLRNSSCNSMLSHLIANYDQKHHLMITKVDQKHNKLVSQLESVIKEFLAGQCLMMDTVRLVDAILSLTSIVKLVAKAIISVVKTAPRPETEISGPVPELYLSNTHKQLLASLEPLYHRLPGLQLSLQSTIEHSLFTFSSEVKPICLLMNLTQFYLAIIANPLENSNPARLFICKCLYFYNQKSVPMIYETLCVYPSVLPKREDPTYDRSDILISTIQSILMSTYYDPEKCDFMTRQILAKLKMFYNYENFKPPKEEVIKNIIAKIRAGRFKNIPYAFALICKRMEQPNTEKSILGELLLPLANEFYNTLSQGNENDEKIACVLECISFIIKPFTLVTDISPYVNLFLRFMKATERQVIQEAALTAILRTVRFGYVQCFNAIYNFKPAYELSDTTKSMLRSFIYKKGLKFLEQLERQAKVLVDN